MWTSDQLRSIVCTGLALVPVMMASVAFAQTPAGTRPPPPPLAPTHAPSHVVDLMTAEGSAAFSARWKTMEAKIVDVPAIPNSMPEYKTTYDISPHAGEEGFEDSSWPTIDPKGLADRRGGGKVSFIWFRSNLTMPARIGNFETAGATAVLTINVDDYAEIWVNGQMPRRGGVTSPATIQGFGMSNRVVLADSVTAGDTFQIAVFAMNGPISVAGANFVFVRQAAIEFYK
jgi:hypothetical protein